MRIPAQFADWPDSPSDEQVLGLLDAAGCAALLVDGYVVDANRAAQELLGLDSGELRGRVIEELVTPVGAARLPEPRASGAPVFGKGRLLQAGARGRLVRISACSLSAGGQGRCLWTFATLAVASDVEAPDLLDALPVMVYRRETDARWTLREVNAGVAELFGCSGDGAPGPGDSLRELIAVDDRERVAREIDGASVRGDGRFRVVYRVNASDGSQRWVCDRGRLVGQLVVGAVVDLEGDEHGRAGLRGRQRMLAELMSHLPSVLYRARNTPSWTMEFISDGCRSLTGYDEDQLVDDRDVTYGELIHPEDRQRVWHDTQQALAEFRPFRISYRIRTARDEEKWVWEQGVGVYSADNEAVAVEGFITDVTARKRTEHTLSTSQHALARLLSNLPGMAYRCRNEPDWMFEFVSEGCFDLTGYLSTDLVFSRTVAYGDLIVPEDRERVWNEVQQGVRQRKPFASTYRIVGANGDEKWVWDRGNAVYAADGGVVAIEGFVSDVSDVVRKARAMGRDPEQ